MDQSKNIKDLSRCFSELENEIINRYCESFGMYPESFDPDGIRTPERIACMEACTCLTKMSIEAVDHERVIRVLFLGRRDQKINEEHIIKNAPELHELLLKLSNRLKDE